MGGGLPLEDWAERVKGSYGAAQPDAGLVRTHRIVAVKHIGEMGVDLGAAGAQDMAQGILGGHSRPDQRPGGCFGGCFGGLVVFWLVHSVPRPFSGLVKTPL